MFLEKDDKFMNYFMFLIQMVKKQSPPPAIQVKTGLGQTMKEGFAMGIGSAIGHRLVGSLFASNTPTQNPIQTPPLDCKKIMVDYDQCVLVSECSPVVMKKLSDEMTQCQKLHR